MANESLSKAKEAKNDEFYTQYHDIEKEISAYLEYNPDVFRGKTVLLPCDDPEWSNFTKYFAQNFEKFGLKRLISTSYAPESKRYKFGYQPSLFETEAPHFDADKSKTHGKIFVLDHDVTGDGKINVEDLQWQYLEGDGDFRSAEICKLRDQADFIITNPPFSLFRTFLLWIMEAKKQFLIIGNKNCITYKEVFPLIKENQLWSGRTEWSGGMWFETKYDDIDRRWITENEIRYLENYDAIEVPYTDAIPDDYDGKMGVPVSFLDKYCPEQFEILGIGLELANMDIIRDKLGKLNGGPRMYVERNGELVRLYERILIRKKQ